MLIMHNYKQIVGEAFRKFCTDKSQQSFLSNCLTKLMKRSLMSY